MTHSSNVIYYVPIVGPTDKQTVGSAIQYSVFDHNRAIAQVPFILMLSQKDILESTPEGSNGPWVVDLDYRIPKNALYLTQQEARDALDDFVVPCIINTVRAEEKRVGSLYRD